MRTVGGRAGGGVAGAPERPGAGQPFQHRQLALADDVQRRARSVLGRSARRLLGDEPAERPRQRRRAAGVTRSSDSPQMIPSADQQVQRGVDRRGGSRAALVTRHGGRPGGQGPVRGTGQPAPDQVTRTTRWPYRTRPLTRATDARWSARPASTAMDAGSGAVRSGRSRTSARAPRPLGTSQSANVISVIRYRLCERSPHARLSTACQSWPWRRTRRSPMFRPGLAARWPTVTTRSVSLLLHSFRRAVPVRPAHRVPRPGRQPAVHTPAYGDQPLAARFVPARGKPRTEWCGASLREADTLRDAGADLAGRQQGPVRLVEVDHVRVELDAGVLHRADQFGDLLRHGDARAVGRFAGHGRRPGTPRGSSGCPRRPGPARKRGE